ncbi:MAG: hypothetical protein LBB62_05130 [Proteiniphilum sp.]|jgi:hypothetical protein|nr:hypothetical protein [Proteiniphilum sp.]
MEDKITALQNEVDYWRKKYAEFLNQTVDMQDELCRRINRLFRERDEAYMEILKLKGQHEETAGCKVLPLRKY